MKFHFEYNGFQIELEVFLSMTCFRATFEPLYLFGYGNLKMK